MRLLLFSALLLFSTLVVAHEGVPVTGKEIDPNQDTPAPPQGDPVPLPPEPTPVPYTEPYEPAPTPLPGVPGDPPSEWDHIPEYEPNGWNCWKWEYGDWSPNPWCN